MIPITHRTKEQAREISAKGGVASGVARRERKAAKEAMRLILAGGIPKDGETSEIRNFLLSTGLEPSDLNMQAALLAGQTLSGVRGNHQAAQLVLSLAGEIKTDEIDIIESAHEALVNRSYVEASLDFWKYCKLKVPTIYTDEAKYLKIMCKKLQDFIDDVDGDEVAIFNLPPGHGKTLTARLFGQWVLGRDKTKKIMAVAYNHDFATDFSKAVRDSISEEKLDKDIPVFKDIFFDVSVERGGARIDKWKLKGSPEYNFLAVSPGSASTGYRVHLAIIDDVIKGSYEAHNRKCLDDLWSWFSNTFYSRRERGRKIAIFSTRWATKDLCGRLIDNCVKNNRSYMLMSRKAFDGEKMLNSELLTRAEYNDILTVVGEDIAKANYDQEPIDLKGRLYGEFATYKTGELPNLKDVYAQCDIADTGSDFICNIIYGLPQGKDANAYVISVLYTQDDMDKTEDRIVRQLIDYGVEAMRLESNFGGRAWAKVLQEKYKKAGGTGCKIKTFSQHANKEAKILATASTVTRKIIMPVDWGTRWRQFYSDVTEYQRAGKNRHDDAPDCLSEICIKMQWGLKFIGIGEEEG